MVVDITGKRYKKGMTAEEKKKVDDYNNPQKEGVAKKEIRIRSYEKAKVEFAYWCALDYVDYGGLRDPNTSGKLTDPDTSDMLTPDRKIKLKRKNRK